MATFPALQPASRTYTPGFYSHTNVATLSLQPARIRQSNVVINQLLRFTFVALTEAEMLSIYAHYNGQKGQFLSFDLPNAVFTGVQQKAYISPAGYSWIYSKSPAVRDIVNNRYTVDVELECVPPEGANVTGFNGAVATVIMGGAATAGASLAGAGLTSTVSMGSGAATADYEAAAVDLPVTVTLEVGAATGD